MSKYSLITTPPFCNENNEALVLWEDLEGAGGDGGGRGDRDGEDM